MLMQLNSSINQDIINHFNNLNQYLRSWLSSGICQSNSGAFFAWKDCFSNKVAFEYPEITGYVLTYYSHLKNINDLEIRSAQKAADWLNKKIMKGDLSCRPANKSIYSFDLGMIATGLISFGNNFCCETSKNNGIKIANYLIELILNNKSKFTVFPEIESDKWSIVGQNHLSKLVQCLLLAAENGLPRAEETAAYLMRTIIKNLNEDGVFKDNNLTEKFYLHPHLYMIEGLWIWGTAKGDESILSLARKALEWTISRQLKSGGFPEHISFNGLSLEKEQSDVTSQVVRMAKLLNIEFPGYLNAMLRLSQIAYGDVNTKAILYEPDSNKLHQNSWTTLFTFQAIQLATGDVSYLNWDELI